MARRRKGNRIDGWLVIDKPLGVTSAAVVNKARWALRAQKAGHSGTLDPLASGCLAIAFGEATKTIPVAQEGDKTYRFSVRWGAATATDDLEGEIIAQRSERPTRAAIEAALPAFRGEIQQVPPQFSAVKVDGQRAYAVARAGGVAEIAPKSLTVSKLILLDWQGPDEAVFELVCGKGGYVRSIARDLGEVLGCLGHVSTLRRLATGPFDLSELVPFEAFDALREAGRVPELLPLERGLQGLRRIDVDDRSAEDLRLGREILVPGAHDAGGAAWAACGDRAVALGRVTGGRFRPSRVFHRGEAGDVLSDPPVTEGDVDR